MDPIATLRTALDDTLPLAERLEAFSALVDWIDAGGFEPPTLRDAATMRALQRLAMAEELREAFPNSDVKLMWLAEELGR